MILESTLDFLEKNHKNIIDNLRIVEVRFGTRMTAVKLSDNSYGVVSTLMDLHHQCIKKKRDFEDFTPLKISGQYVSDLFKTTKESNLINTLRIAILNAISTTIISQGKYKIIEDADPIDLIDLNSRKTITIVGAFNSYIKKIAPTDNELHVLELDKYAIADDFRKYFVPAQDYKLVIPKSDIVIITGLTLVNNTIDDLLAAVSPNTQVILTGPSSNIIPDILFQNKVNIIGTTRILNPDLLFQLVSEMGTVYHMFKYCAQKISIVNE